MLARRLLGLLLVVMVTEGRWWMEGDVRVEVLRVPETCDFSSEHGDTLRIHYTGEFDDGEQFDSSYKRNTPVHFVLGESNVVQGWHLGLKDMCIGEKRRLTVPPHLAYGDKGSGKVPPGEAGSQVHIGVLLHVTMLQEPR